MNGRKARALHKAKPHTPRLNTTPLRVVTVDKGDGVTEQVSVNRAELRRLSRPARSQQRRLERFIAKRALRLMRRDAGFIGATNRGIKR